MIASDRFRVAVQTGLAMVLANGFALAMHRPKPRLAGVAAVFCALSTAGESSNKGTLPRCGDLARSTPGAASDRIVRLGSSWACLNAASVGNATNLAFQYPGFDDRIHGSGDGRGFPMDW